MVLSGLHFSSEVNAQCSAIDLPGTFLSCFLPRLQRGRGKDYSTKVDGTFRAEMLLTNLKVKCKFFCDS